MMKGPISSVFLSSSLLLSSLSLTGLGGVYGWGTEGHSLVGKVAQAFLTAQGTAYVKSLLPDGDLAEIASWADRVKRTPQYSWTSALHYADSKDAPPTSCSYVDERDCPDGKCIIGAVTFFTDVLFSCSPKYPQGDALKFLVHFLGDLTQPLHLCEKERGGNEVNVLFDKRTVNLHAAWDNSIPEKRLKDFDGSDVYAGYLVDNINSVWKDQAITWLPMTNALTDVNSLGHLLSAITWAKDSDGYDCSVVWPEFIRDPTQNFGEAYYEMAAPIVDIQLAKGGYRLASWINTIASKASYTSCNVHSGDQAAPEMPEGGIFGERPVPRKRPRPDSPTPPAPQRKKKSGVFMVTKKTQTRNPYYYPPSIRPVSDRSAFADGDSGDSSRSLTHPHYRPSGRRDGATITEATTPDSADAEGDDDLILNLVF